MHLCRQFKIKPGIDDGSKKHVCLMYGISEEQFPALVELCAEVIKREIEVKNFNIIFGSDLLGHVIGAKLAKNYFGKRFISPQVAKRR